MTRRLRFTLLGTGSSGGVPRIGNDWGACDPNEPKNRRSRCSAMVEVFREGETEPTRVLIDTAPDLREQLLRAEIGRVDAIIFSHEHADQVGGLDDVRVLAIRQRAQVPVYMDARTAGDLTTRFAYCFKGAHGYPPMLALQDFIVPGRPASIEGPGGPVEFLPLDQVHGVIRSLGFRIGKLAYCNDVNDLPAPSLEALTGLDVFVVDALRYAPHPSHANLEQAISWARSLKARRTVLTNLHVDMDYQTLLRELPDGIVPGFDGLTIELDLV